MDSMDIAFGSSIFVIIIMMFGVIGYAIYQDVTEDDIAFSGIIEAKTTKNYDGGIFGGGGSEYYFTMNTSDVLVVTKVNFEDYARYNVGDSYNYTLGTKTEKNELKLLKGE